MSGKHTKEKIAVVYVGRHTGQEGYWVGVEKPSASKYTPDGWGMNRSGGADYISAKLAEDIFPELPGEGQWIETRNRNEVEESERVTGVDGYNYINGADIYSIPVGSKHPTAHNLEAWMPFCSRITTSYGRTWKADAGWDIEAE